MKKDELSNHNDIAGQMIYIEHVFNILKRFKILSTVYRGRIVNFNDKFFYEQRFTAIVVKGRKDLRFWDRKIDGGGVKNYVS